MAKPNIKLEAIKLRKKGFSYSYLQQRLNVSKSILSLWLKSVPYTPIGTAHVTIRSQGKREYGVLLMRRILESIEIVKKEAGLV